jgi:hypothetical protein
MAKIISLRTCGRATAAVGLLSFSFLLGSLNPFLKAAPGAPQAAGTTAPAVTVNHFRKGNRLPIMTNSSALKLVAPGFGQRRLRAPNRLEATDKLPLGCDAVLSPVAAPSRVVVYGRCMV